MQVTMIPHHVAGLASSRIRSKSIQQIKRPPDLNPESFAWALSFRTQRPDKAHVNQLFSQHPEAIQILGHAAYGLVLCSFIVKRMLVLRLFAVPASLLSILFNYYSAGAPVWIPIQWNVLFLLVNCFHIGMALAAQRKIELPADKEFIYQKNFTSMTRVEFKRLLAVGHTRTYHTGHQLIAQHDQIDSIFMIVEGSAQVRINGHTVATLTQGEFIGEMSFLTHQLTRGEVTMAQTTKIHYWDEQDLRVFFAKNPTILASFHSAIGNQLISRLLAQKSVRPTSAQAA